jgi:hypothetical protein
VNKCTSGGRAISGSENELDFAWLANSVVLAAVLITVGVSSDNDGLSPAGHKSWDIVNDNSLSEHGTVENITDGAVGGLPHLLKLELLNTTSVRGNGSALDTNLGSKHSVSTINGNLIVSGVTVLN